MKNKLSELLSQINKLKQNMDDAIKLPDNTYYMDNDLILSGVRCKGVSRYPYTKDGLVVWAAHNGYTPFAIFTKEQLKDLVIEIVD